MITFQFERCKWRYFCSACNLQNLSSTQLFPCLSVGFISVITPIQFCEGRAGMLCSFCTNVSLSVGLVLVFCFVGLFFSLVLFLNEGREF